MGAATSSTPAPTLDDVLLVEGQEDVEFFYEVRKYLGRSSRIRIKDGKGINRLLAILPVELKGSGLGTLGIVVDADRSAQARWDSVRQRLISFGYDKAQIPRNPVSGGFILRDGVRPNVGVWIMPDNASSGALEEFAKTLVPTGDKLWPLAESTIQQVLVTERRFVATHIMKATLHTWLSWQRESGKPIGIAISSRFLNRTSPLADELYVWLRKLFVI